MPLKVSSISHPCPPTQGIDSIGLNLAGIASDYNVLMISRSVARGVSTSLGSQWYLPTIPMGVNRAYLTAIEGYNWEPEGVEYIVIVPIGEGRN